MTGMEWLWGSLLAGAFTLVGVTLGHVLSARQEAARRVIERDAKWQRDLLTLATEFMSFLDQRRHAIDASIRAGDNGGVLDDMLDKFTALRLIAPIEVVMAARRCLDTRISAGRLSGDERGDALKLVQAADLAYVDCVREALGVGRFQWGTLRAQPE